MSSPSSASKLASGRVLVWLAIAALLIGGGWYFFFNDSPQLAIANVQKSSPSLSKKQQPATKPSAVATSMPATRPASPSASPQTEAPPTDLLSGEYSDDVLGFAIRFPKDWAIQT